MLSLIRKDQVIGLRLLKIYNSAKQMLPDIDSRKQLIKSKEERKHMVGRLCSSSYYKSLLLINV